MWLKIDCGKPVCVVNVIRFCPFETTFMVEFTHARTTKIYACFHSCVHNALFHVLFAEELDYYGNTVMFHVVLC
jgi:hypothetical protein